MNTLLFFLWRYIHSWKFGVVDEKDWQLRHGRTTVLSVGLKEAPAVIYSEKRRSKVDKFVTAMLSSDKVNPLPVVFVVFLDDGS